MAIDEKRLVEIRVCAERWAEQDDESAEAVRGLFVMLDEERKRAEDAERKLASLHAAVAAVRVEVSTSEPDVREALLALDDAGRTFAALREAHANAAPVAEQHDREVRAKELRRLADNSASARLYDWLLAEADRIERGEA